MSEKKSWNPVKRLSHCSCHKLTGGHEAGLFERLLMLLIPHFDIIKSPAKGEGGTETTVYLRRFYLFRSKWFGMNFGDVYLHHIVRSDDDPDPHDHPWGFTGLILSGGYMDQSWKWNAPQLVLETTVSTMVCDACEGCGTWGNVGFESTCETCDGQGFKTLMGARKFITQQGHRTGPHLERVRPLTVIRREAEHIHRVIVAPGKTAWTLIFTSGYNRDWNFITESGPVMWRKYLGIPAGVDVGE